MSDGVEEAIISLVVEGAALASQAANKVEVDLTSAERAGKRAESASTSAEKAARDAESSVRQLDTQVRSAIVNLHRAASLLNKAAKAAGAGDEASAGIEALSEGAGTAAQVYRLTSALGPEVSIPLAAIAGVADAGYTYFSKANEAEQRRQKEQARAVADELRNRDSSGDSLDLANILLQQAGMAKLGSLGNRGGRQVP